MRDCANADHALVSIGKELEKNLDNWEAWAAKADILLSLGIIDVAIRCCDRSLAINSDNPLAWITKGKALDKLGKREDAEAAFAKAKELGHVGPSSYQRKEND